MILIGMTAKRFNYCYNAISLLEIEMASGVYSILCLKNKKLYIGSAKSVKIRIYEHKRTLNKGSHHNCHLQKAWDKYGEDSFQFLIVQLVDDIDLLIATEQYWIDKAQAANPAFGFNICNIAGSALGTKRTPDQRKRISDGHLGIGAGKQLSAAHIQRIREANTGRYPSEETRKKMSDAAKARVRAPCSNETKAKIGIANSGKSPSSETRKKMSDAAKVRCISLSTREKLREKTLNYWKRKKECLI
jgi:group I intron endonuclease